MPCAFVQTKLIRPRLDLNLRPRTNPSLTYPHQRVVVVHNRISTRPLILRQWSIILEPGRARKTRMCILRRARKGRKEVNKTQQSVREGCVWCGVGGGAWECERACACASGGVRTATRIRTLGSGKWDAISLSLSSLPSLAAAVAVHRIRPITRHPLLLYSLQPRRLRNFRIQCTY